MRICVLFKYIWSILLSSVGSCILHSGEKNVTLKRPTATLNRHRKSQMEKGKNVTLEETSHFCERGSRFPANTKSALFLVRIPAILTNQDGALPRAGVSQIIIIKSVHKPVTPEEGRASWCAPPERNKQWSDKS